MNWQPITKAPKRGKHILVFCPSESGGYMTVAWWDSKFDTVYSERSERTRYVGGWTDGTASCVGRLDAEYNRLEPTHWMPLPDPPAARTES